MIYVHPPKHTTYSSIGQYLRHLPMQPPVAGTVQCMHDVGFYHMGQLNMRQQSIRIIWSLTPLFNPTDGPPHQALPEPNIPKDDFSVNTPQFKN
jgi:hypothetical protein